jgi:uncharacterized membrane protein YphA (DoxX/SURF4 family)
MFASINKAFGALAPLNGIARWFVFLPWSAVFLYHGVTKFTNGIDGFAGMLSGFGGMAYPIAVLVALGEVLAGIGALVGAFSKSEMGDAATRLAGLAGFPIMLGAIFMVHLPNGWNVMQGGMEFQVLLLGVAIYMMIRGNTD